MGQRDPSRAALTLLRAPQLFTTPGCTWIVMRVYREGNATLVLHDAGYRIWSSDNPQPFTAGNAITLDRLGRPGRSWVYQSCPYEELLPRAL